ncbi:hypothetical protein HMPREF1219_01593 [Corynebacterium pyruviciproducens ATCC BAA-1742]|uniref:Acyltransferase 3 domain-containing protein n=1 Tax=Corynebacterium pyruviciproducens ATCC BAA-1742 TaxID=1125779 RepID=S2ZEH5_9CORY|nr:acyltransferase [Corynebacterium pyruviciproducens]EPD68412.1 hypothetical protein HMPREF1219_01593 [Corynebacterium pyruviciproducens ATCC BAA-1742]
MSKSYLPALDALRAISALGIMTTHVAFQSGLGVRVVERFDYFVAVFFALSGFLLWWRYSSGWARYVRSRFLRIVPAYVAVLVITFSVFNSAGVGAFIANLSFVQIFVPGALMTGLTHLWTMCVEVAFYVIFPFLKEIVGRLPTLRLRVGVVALVGVASLGWAYIPALQDGWAVNTQIFPPAYCSWYAVGIILAELFMAGRIPRVPLWACGVVAGVALVAGTYLGPAGLTHPTPGQFAVRILFGAVFAWALLHPVVERRPDVPGWIGFLGRISYSIFLWHLPVLTAIYALTPIPLFGGKFVAVWVLTFLFTIPVSYVSYEWTERPFHSSGKMTPALQ